jgi:DNA-binding transcriptional regulator YiaG
MAKKKTRKAYHRRSTEEQIVDLEKQIAALRAQAKEEKKFSPKTVFDDRKRLELSRADYAELVEVSALTIYHWEHGHSKPRAAQLARWLDIKTLGKPEAWTKLGYE